MPIINVDIYEECSNEQKKQLIEQLCQVTNKLFPIPPDKIVVLIREFPVTNWGQAGVVATDPNYYELSRRTK